jgi:hypothetical protein
MCGLTIPIRVLHVQGVDSFGSIDLADPLEACGDEPAVRDLSHRG